MYGFWDIMRHNNPRSILFLQWRKFIEVVHLKAKKFEILLANLVFKQPFYPTSKRWTEKNSNTTVIAHKIWRGIIPIQLPITYNKRQACSIKFNFSVEIQHKNLCHLFWVGKTRLRISYLVSVIPWCSSKSFCSRNSRDENIKFVFLEV